MALILDKSRGTQTATINTEHTLLTEAASGIYVLFLDLVNLAAADIVELRAYSKVLTAGTSHLVFEQSYANKKGDGLSAGSSGKGPVIVKSPPIESPFQLVWTLKQVAGTGRAFDWREDQLA